MKAYTLFTPQSLSIYVSVYKSCIVLLRTPWDLAS